jgi:hypothetical protein
MNDELKRIEIKNKDWPVTLYIPVKELYGTNGAGLGMYFKLTDQFMFGWIKAKERLLFGRLDYNGEIIRGIVSSGQIGEGGIFLITRNSEIAQRENSVCLDSRTDREEMTRECWPDLQNILQLNQNRTSIQIFKIKPIAVVANSA